MPSSGTSGAGLSLWVDGSDIEAAELPSIRQEYGRDGDEVYGLEYILLVRKLLMGTQVSCFDRGRGRSLQVV